MAFAIVNPLAALWKGRGLSCLLLPVDCNVLSTLTNITRPSQEKTKADTEPHERRTFSQTTTAKGSNTTKNFAKKTKESTSNTDIQTRPKTTNTLSGPASVQHLPPDAWPAAWQQRLAQTRRGRIVWTYRDLGLDLCDARTEGRQERSLFLRQLLRDLGHPPGTHTFWPVCLPLPQNSATPEKEKDVYMANAQIFWSGVHCLEARGVVIMGSAAAEAAGLRQKFQPLQQILHNGHFVWMLWDVDTIINLEQRYNSVLAFLKNSLHQLLR